VTAHDTKPGSCACRYALIYDPTFDKCDVRVPAPTPMKHLVFWLLTYLIAWSCGVAGLTFTNSFEGWTGNRTYRISWEESDSDPSYYDLELVRPHGIHSVGVPSNASWLEEWSFKYAIQSMYSNQASRKFKLTLDTLSSPKWRPFYSGSTWPRGLAGVS
jgi:hypothetical protein